MTSLVYPEVYEAEVSARPPGPGLNPARWTAIMRSPELRTGNFVTSLVDGKDTFMAMERAIRTATNSEHYIYLLGWILYDDFPLASASIRDLFTAAAQGGVQVRVMLWDQLGTKNSA